MKSPDPARTEKINAILDAAPTDHEKVIAYQRFILTELDELNQRLTARVIELSAA